MKKLNEIINDPKTTPLKKYVAQDIIDEADSYLEKGQKLNKKAIQSFLEDLNTSGCQGGMISGLIYYSDTHAFFDKYSDDIFELIDELEASFGTPIEVKDKDRKNFYAWLAYEETARQIGQDLGIEL